MPERADAGQAGIGGVEAKRHSFGTVSDTVESALLALTGAGYQEAVQTLRAVAERATRRRKERGVA